MEKIIKSTTKNKNISLLQIIIFLCFSFCVSSFVSCVIEKAFFCFDDDTFWIIATGREIINNKAIPTINPFTMHKNLVFVAHQWLYCVITAFLYDYVGEWSLSAAVIALMGITVLITYALCRQFTKNKLFALFVSCELVAIIGDFFACHPNSVSIPVYVCMLLCWTKAKENKKWLFPIPILSLLEANMHTSLWFMFPVFSLPFILPEQVPYHTTTKEYVKEYFFKKKHYLICYMSLLVCGLLNPYNITGMLYPVISYKTVTNNMIEELRSPTLSSVDGIIILVCIVVFCIYILKNFVILKKYNKLPINLNYCCLFAGCLFLSIMHMRNIWFCLISAIPFCVTILNQTTRISISRTGLRNAVLLSLMVVLCLSYMHFSKLSYMKINNMNMFDIPEKIVDYIDESRKDNDLKIYAEIKTGGYLEFRGYKTYIDGRPEIYSSVLNKKADIYAEYTEVNNGTLDYQEWLDKYEFTDVIVSNSPLKIFMDHNEDYKKIMKDGIFNFYIRII